MHQLDRRAFFGLAAAGLLGALGACSSSHPHPPAAAASTPTSSPPGTAVPQTPLPSAEAEAGRIPAPHPGPPVVITKPPHGVTSVALTIDDGTCADCVAAYAAFAETTGTPITFSPNGKFRDSWDRQAARLRPLVASGQVQIGNHTWSHRNIVGRKDADLEADIRRNEEWIEEQFGITSRPWFRPPYGAHDKHSDAVAAGLGYTNILLWNGSFGDAAVLSPRQLLKQADRYLKAGTIMLGHANHPTVTHLFPQLLRMLQDRRLEPVTLDTMFGTSRAIG